MKQKQQSKSEKSRNKMKTKNQKNPQKAEANERVPSLSAYGKLIHTLMQSDTSTHMHTE